MFFRKSRLLNFIKGRCMKTTQVKIAVMGPHEEKKKLLGMLKTLYANNPVVGVYDTQCDEHSVTSVGDEPIVIYYGVCPNPHVEPTTQKVIYIDSHPYAETANDKLYKTHVLKAYRSPDVYFIPYGLNDTCISLDTSSSIMGIRLFIKNIMLDNRIAGGVPTTSHSKIRTPRKLGIPS